jgi:hypothetical protein
VGWLARLAAPRVQGPIAAGAALVMTAVLLLHAIGLASIVAGVAEVGAALVAIAAVPLTRTVLLRSRDDIESYQRAVILPPVVAAVVGPAVVGYAQYVSRDLALSFAGLRLSEFDGWVVPVAAISVCLGFVGSALLVGLAWVATRTTSADPIRGARRFTALAWTVAACEAVLARTAGGPRLAIVSGVVLSITFAVAAVCGFSWWIERRAAVAPVSPYR